MSKKDEIKDFLAEYEDKKDVYTNFSELIKNKSEQILKNNKDECFYQIITNRLKEKNSLEKKLKDWKFKNLADVDDIAGCRIIFYLESHIEKFKELLYEYFGNENIEKNNLRYSKNGYNAVHIVISLKNYSQILKNFIDEETFDKFLNLKCEIQLTTVLYHAWSEMNHDIIYKQSKELKNFDEKKFKVLESSFSDIMENHLKKASYSFEFIYEEFESIKNGKNIFDIKFLDSIKDSSSNNEIYEKLKILKNYVNEFGDKFPKNLKLFDFIEYIIKKSKTINPTPINNLFGEFNGYTTFDIIDILIDIIDLVKFYYFDEAFSTLLILSKEDNFNIRKKSGDILSKIAEFNLNLVDKDEFKFQFSLLDKLENFNESEKQDYFDIILKICEKLFITNFYHTSHDSFDSLEISTIEFKESENLKSIRIKSLDILMNLFKITNNEQKVEIIKTLKSLGHKIPSLSQNTNIENIKIDNVIYLIDFYLKNIKDYDLPILSEIEKQVRLFINWFNLQDKSNAFELLNLLESNIEYQFYRALLGDSYDYKKDTKIEEFEQEQKIDEFIRLILKDDSKYLEELILKIISKNNYVFNIYPNTKSFCLFIKKIIEKKPKFILDIFINHNENIHEGFLYYLMNFLIEINKNEIEIILKKWIKENKKIELIIRFACCNKNINLEILEKIINNYKKSKEKTILNCLALFLSYRYDDGNEKIKNMFLDIIKRHNEIENISWLNFNFKLDIVKDLIETEIDIILDNLSLDNNFEYNTQRVLGVILEKFPKKGIKFLYEKFLDRYDYNILDRALKSNIEKYKEPIMNEFLDLEYNLFLSVYGIIIKLYPNFDDNSNTLLLNYLDSTEDKDKLKKFILILQLYKTNSIIINLCKKIIFTYDIQKEEKEILFSILSSSGVTIGSDGITKFYERRINEITSWEDENQNIKLFKKEFIKYLKEKKNYFNKFENDTINKLELKFKSKK